MSNKAIIIAANPEINDDLGNVEKHKEHAEQVGKVFWDLVPPGQREISWKHPEIQNGYFYISGTGKIQYKFLIDKAGTVSEFKKSSLWDDEKKFIPKKIRNEQWEKYSYDYFFALLIKNIVKIDPISLEEFQLVNTGESAKRVMNYIIVKDDKRTPEVLS